MWGYVDHTLSHDNVDYKQLDGMINWKNRNPNLKVMWSLGGLSYSTPFFDMAASYSTRKIFIDSVINWLSQPSMFFVDGIDINWEYPGGHGADENKGTPEIDAANYLDLIKELRRALDILG